MLAKVFSYGVTGLEAYPVTIEVDVSNGLPATVVVGLPDNAVKESKERVRAAVQNSGYEYESGRITVNLSPADVKKEGPAFDLPIALGILAASGQVRAESLGRYAILGELALDGHIHPVRGALSVAMAVPGTKFDGLLLPAANAPEAAVTGRINVYPVGHIKEVLGFLSRPDSIRPLKVDLSGILGQAPAYPFDFNEVKGQMSVKRGLEIAAAGAHNALLIGPPGSGKTMLARRLATILPEMTLDEALETTRIHSCLGLVPPKTGLIAHRPFRSPHHTSSDVALVGGGSLPKPGEVTLSHNGILFLDELPEFNRNVLESLRQPLEDHCVTVARASRSVRFPAKFMLIASMNPCPCGHLTDPKRACHCSPPQIQRYLAKISGPLLDRIDLHLEVPAVKPDELLELPAAEPSDQVRKRTAAARKIQQQRLKSVHLFANGQMGPKELKKFCAPSPQGRQLLKDTIERLGLSARAHDRILRVARTIADLDQQQHIHPHHIAEAIQYRTLDRNWWG